ncbi:MAG: ABC transporter substrate-binding protein, partial [Pseudomonadota bacterium]
MDRRSFLTTSAGAVAAGSGLWLPQGAAAQSQPKRGGVLRVGMSSGSTDDSMDPRTWLDANMYTIGFTTANALVELTPEKLPVPQLAESWESSPDAKRWVFRIREGVEFHNGKTMTPADVVWSLKRHLADESKSLAKGFLSAVTDIRADGQNVIIEHATGDADIPAILGVYQLVIIPEDWTDFSTIAGTGPYRQVSYEPGGRFVGERNPNYWKSDRGWFDRVEMTTIPDPQAREQALIDGAVDAIDNVNFLTFDRYRDNPDFTALETKGGRFITMVMDVRSAPFNDSNVRNAVKYAVARQDIIDKVIGYAVMGNDHPVPPSDPFFHTELPQRPFDPKKARWRLRQAGIDRLNINLSVSETAFTGGVDTGILMQDTAFLSGIDLNITREKDDGYWSNVWMKKPFVQSFWTLRPTPAMMYTVAFACGSPSA